MTPALRDPFALYQLLGPLRLDGVGTLECARSLSTGQRVCLRRVPNSAQAQAVAEQALSLPRHEALAAALDAGVWQDFTWLVSEFPEGKLLGDAAESAVAAHALAAEFAPVAEALAVLHETARAHGLISGEALLVTESGRLLLHEAPLLELNRVTDRRPEQTALAQLQRTAPFFAPERLKGGPPTAAGDVYGLGVLVGLLGGAPPPPGSSALERVHALMVGSWRPGAPAGFPRGFTELLERMTAADPAQRPSSAEVALRLVGLGRVDAPVPVAATFPAPVPTAPGAPSFVQPAPPLLLPRLPPHLAALMPPVPTAPSSEPMGGLDTPAIVAPVSTAPFGRLGRAAPGLPETTDSAAGVVAPPELTDPAAPIVAPPTVAIPQVAAPQASSASAAVDPAKLILVTPAPTVEFPAPRLPAPAPTVPSVPPAWMLQSGGAKLLDLSPGKSPPPRPLSAPPLQRGLFAALSHWAAGFTVSIAASDFKLIATSMIAMAMLASTVALGAHVLSLRNEAAELAQVDVLKVRPVAREPKYNAEQLKQIMRQKEAAHHEY